MNGNEALHARVMAKKDVDPRMAPLVAELSRVAAMPRSTQSRGVVLYAGRRSLPFGPRLHVMPLTALRRADEA